MSLGLHPLGTMPLGVTEDEAVAAGAFVKIVGSGQRLAGIGGLVGTLLLLWWLGVI